MTISIIIVSYNTKACLRKALASVYSSCISLPFETIVVDNNSSDGSVEMVRSEFPAVRLIENDRNVGLGTGVNTGMRIARGDAYFLLNSDAQLFPGVLEALARQLEEQKCCAMAGPKVIGEDGTVQYTAGRDLGLTTMLLRSIRPLAPKYLIPLIRSLRCRQWLSPGRPREVESLSAVALLVNRDFVDQQGGFDENIFMYAEDLDWSHRARMTGWGLWYVPTVSIVHSESASSEGPFRPPNHLNIESILYYYEKHRSKISVVTLRMLIILGSLVHIAKGGLRYLTTLGKAHSQDMQVGFRELRIVLDGRRRL